MRTKTVPWCAHAVNVPGVRLKDYHKETAFQVYVADWLRKQYELTKDPRYTRWHHSANERRGARAGFLARMMGQAKGMPDFLHYGRSIALELKVPGQQLTPEQVDWLEYFDSIGWVTAVLDSFERVQELVLKDFATNRNHWRCR